MSPLLVIVVFYGLLALAMLLLRGDLTAWPPVADRILAMVVSLGAVGWLLRGWSSRQPLADAAGGGVGRARSMWLWWAGLVGLAAAVFLGKILRKWIALLLMLRVMWLRILLRLGLPINVKFRFLTRLVLLSQLLFTLKRLVRQNLKTRRLLI